MFYRPSVLGKSDNLPIYEISSRNCIMSRRRPSTPGWSPERKLWDELERLSEDLSWKKVELDQKRAHLVSKNDRGVYLICASPPIKTISAINAYTILYAGQVKSYNRSLQNRFLEHIRYPSPQLKLFLNCYYPTVHFWFAVVQDQSKINELEALLIETFNPPCNDIKAPGTQILLARIGVGRIIGAGRKHRTT